MLITFSEHAKERFFQRNISDLDVKRVLLNKNINKIVNVLGKVKFRTEYKGDLLNVVIAGTNSEATVITAY
ncbi:MAG: DUF4258 domain-containing protein [Candidatus Muirbacterium halophilum]|nr:DUF4258 domain-containing protein [Candidatus Muirbacterium halophilum]MCK9474331.1 DUF4258 domain-containing protein [Candidatus Muirbacterium halophilum]